MQSFTHIWNIVMSIGVFVSIAFCLKLLYALSVRTDWYSQKVLGFTEKYILWIGAFFSIASMVSSLVYSGIIGYEPCMLCWYARIAFYPQAIMYVMALIKRDKSILDYSLALCIFGIVITAYNYYLGWGGSALIPCSASGPSCATNYVFEFGFITIPLMGLVGFVTLALAVLAAKQASKTKVL